MNEGLKAVDYEKEKGLNMIRKKCVVTTAVAVMMAVALAGCGASANNTTGNEITSTIGSASGSTSGNASSSSSSSNATGSVVATGDSEIFTERDLEQQADLSDATNLTVTSGQDITITKKGVYVISGTATDCTIIVEAVDDEKVQLVLDGVSITNTDAPAVYVKSGDKVFVTTTSGSTNTFSTTGTFVADGETNLDAVIFSKSDLVLNGLGTLNITSTKANGIACKDDLKVTGGTYQITSAEDSIEANDSISICDGTFTITSSKDAIHCEYDEDDTVGSVYISGGTFNISAVDDGIQATTIAQIEGGTIHITKCVEGIEGTYVLINGGTIDIASSDDGINASKKSTAYTVQIEFNGGDTTIVMGAGDTDAVDANGNITVNAGNITITGQSSFDFDGTGVINGGTVIVNGSQITTMPTQMIGGGGDGGMGGGNANGNAGGMKGNGNMRW